MLFNLKKIIIFISITIAFTGCGSEFETLLDGKTATRNYTFSWDEFSGIYWSEADGTIHRINFNGTGEEILRVSSNIPLDIAIDTNNSRIFWTEYTGSMYRICRGGFNEDDTVVVYTSTVNFGPSSIAIDNTAGLIYWNEFDSASGHNDIWRSNMSPDSLARIKWMNDFAHDYIYSITIDTYNSRIYFTDASYYDIYITAGNGNAGSAYSGDINDDDSDSQQYSVTGPGSNSIPLKGIAVDGPGGFIYYVTNTNDGKSIARSAIPSISYQPPWIDEGITDIQKIALDTTRRKIYWTSQTDKRIYRADLDTANSNIELFLSLDSMPTGICISQ